MRSPRLSARPWRNGARRRRRRAPSELRSWDSRPVGRLHRGGAPHVEEAADDGDPRKSDDRRDVLANRHRRAPRIRRRPRSLRGAGRAPWLLLPPAKAAFEMIPARQSPNDPDMISIAAGNDATIVKIHERSLSPDVIWLLPEPAIEYASARFSVKSTNKTAPRAALEAVAAAPPTALPGITQHARERGCEPHQVQDVEREEGGGNQNPGAIAVIERDELVRRRTHASADCRR